MSVTVETTLPPAGGGPLIARCEGGRLSPDAAVRSYNQNASNSLQGQAARRAS